MNGLPAYGAFDEAAHLRVSIAFVIRGGNLRYAWISEVRSEALADSTGNGRRGR
jgi:hypothetical protein